MEVFMAHRVNFMLDDQTWEELQSIPRGERSRLVNHAVGNELLNYRRKKAALVMDNIRSGMKPVDGVSDAWIRQDRDHH